jgi:hypothetical protein
MISSLFTSSLCSSARAVPASMFCARAARPGAFRAFTTGSSTRGSNVLNALRFSNTTGRVSFARASVRTFMTDSSTIVARPSQAEAWKRLGITTVKNWSILTSKPFSLEHLNQVTVAGTVIAVNYLFNRETRDALSPAEASYLHRSFQYTGGGLVLTALAARSLFKSGAAVRIMSANPWVVLGVSLVGSIGTMMGAMYTPPENTVLKHAFWLGFNACQAATLSPLFFFSPAILSVCICIRPSDVSYSLSPPIIIAGGIIYVWCCRVAFVYGCNGQERDGPLYGWSSPCWCDRCRPFFPCANGTTVGHAWARNCRSHLSLWRSCGVLWLCGLRVSSLCRCWACHSFTNMSYSLVLRRFSSTLAWRRQVWFRLIHCANLSAFSWTASISCKFACHIIRISV